MSDLWVNDRPIDDLVWQVLALDGHLSAVAARPSVLAVANGGGVIGSEVTVTGRDIVVGLDVRPATIVARTTAIDAITRRTAGLLELRTGDSTSRIIPAIRTGCDVTLYTGTHANPLCYVELRFQAVEAARVDIEPTIRALSTTRVACPVGLIASRPIVRLVGNATPIVDPVIITYDYTGAEVSRLTLTGSLGTNATLVIGRTPELIESYAAGVLQTGTSAGLSWYASGYFPVLSHEDASPDNGDGVTMALSSTSGTPVGDVTYYRRW